MTATRSVRKDMIAMKNLRMSIPSSCCGRGVAGAAMLLSALLFGGRHRDRRARLGLLLGLADVHAELGEDLAGLRIGRDATLLDRDQPLLRVHRVLEVVGDELVVDLDAEHGALLLDRELLQHRLLPALLEALRDVAEHVERRDDIRDVEALQLLLEVLLLLLDREEVVVGLRAARLLGKEGEVDVALVAADEVLLRREASHLDHLELVGDDEEEDEEEDERARDPALRALEAALEAELLLAEVDPRGVVAEALE